MSEAAVLVIILLFAAGVYLYMTYSVEIREWLTSVSGDVAETQEKKPAPEPPAENKPVDPKPTTPADPKPTTPADPKPTTPADTKPTTPADPKATTPAAPKPFGGVDNASASAAITHGSQVRIFTESGKGVVLCTSGCSSTANTLYESDQSYTTFDVSLSGNKIALQVKSSTDSAITSFADNKFIDCNLMVGSSCEWAADWTTGRGSFCKLKNENLFWTVGKPLKLTLTGSLFMIQVKFNDKWMNASSVALNSATLVPLDGYYASNMQLKRIVSLAGAKSGGVIGSFQIQHLPAELATSAPANDVISQYASGKNYINTTLQVNRETNGDLKFVAVPGSQLNSTLAALAGTTWTTLGQNKIVVASGNNGTISCATYCAQNFGKEMSNAGFTTASCVYSRTSNSVVKCGDIAGTNVACFCAGKPDGGGYGDPLPTNLWNCDVQPQHANPGWARYQIPDRVKFIGYDKGRPEMQGKRSLDFYLEYDNTGFERRCTIQVYPRCGAVIIWANGKKLEYAGIKYNDTNGRDEVNYFLAALILIQRRNVIKIRRVICNENLGANGQFANTALLAQIHDQSTNELLIVSDDSWKCIAVNEFD